MKNGKFGFVTKTHDSFLKSLETKIYIKTITLSISGPLQDIPELPPQT